MDLDLGVDPDPMWIQIHVIPIPALFNVILDPDPDPAKNGIVTPLEEMDGSSWPPAPAPRRARNLEFNGRERQ